MSSFKAVSLFSNCGAGDVGYRSAGFQFEVMAELDPHRLEVCLLNHPGAEGVCGDIRKTWPKVISKYREKAGDERPALLCACPPCQGMSSARSGKGKHDDAGAGSKDERNLLVTIIAKVALKLHPSIIVVENVPAFFSRKVYDPKDKLPVSAANYLISRLSKYYVAFPLIADLSDFGIPQSRNRAFITFVRKDIVGLRDLLQYKCSPFPCPRSYSDKSGNATVTISQALARAELPKLDAASENTANAREFDGFHSVPVWNEKIYSMVAAIPKASGRSAWDNDVCKSCGPVVVSQESVLCPNCSIPLPRPVFRENDGTYRLIKGFKSSYRRMHPDRPAATITTASGHVGSDYTIHPTENRLLSPLECALIQTFPVNFKWGNALTKIGYSHVREMIGEAVPPGFTEAHGGILLSLLSGRWFNEPIAEDDIRCKKGWRNLSAAAKKDGRVDPYSLFEKISKTKKINKKNNLHL